MLFFRKTLVFVLFMLVLGAVGQTDRSKKIRWKKLRTEESVKSLVLAYVPLGSSREQVNEFIKVQGLNTYEHVKNTVTFSVLTRSRSLWIEKKWAVSLIFEESQKLKEVKVEAWLTGP